MFYAYAALLTFGYTIIAWRIRSTSRSTHHWALGFRHWWSPSVRYSYCRIPRHPAGLWLPTSNLLRWSGYPCSTSQGISSLASSCGRRIGLSILRRSLRGRCSRDVVLLRCQNRRGGNWCRRGGLLLFVCIFAWSQQWTWRCTRQVGCHHSWVGSSGTQSLPYWPRSSHQQWGQNRPYVCDYQSPESSWWSYRLAT